MLALQLFILIWFTNEFSSLVECHGSPKYSMYDIRVSWLIGIAFFVWQKFIQELAHFLDFVLPGVELVKCSHELVIPLPSEALTDLDGVVNLVKHVEY